MRKDRVIWVITDADGVGVLWRYVTEKEVYESCVVKLERGSRKSRWSSCLPACCIGSNLLSLSPQPAQLQRHSSSAVDVTVAVGTNYDWLTAVWHHWQLSKLAAVTSWLSAQTVIYWQQCDITDSCQHQQLWRHGCWHKLWLIDSCVTSLTAVDGLYWVLYDASSLMAVYIAVITCSNRVSC